MDIVKVLAFKHLKASPQSLYPKQKLFLLVFLLSLFLNLIPHETHALTIKAPTASKPILVFDVNDKSYLAVLDVLNSVYKNKRDEEKVRQEALQRTKLTIKVKNYLEAKRSPLAEYADVLTSVKNWKQIVALANAESTLCRTYPTKLANCWGVGGSNLWDMGNNLGDGILSMNQFLNNYPRKSQLKYAQMSFEQMNGLYKQPAAPHWLFNAKVIYEDLAILEKNI